MKSYNGWQEGNKRHKIIIVSITVLFCLGVFSVYQMKQNSAASNANSINKMQTTVNVLSVQRGDLVKQISLTGKTVPEAQVDIAAKYQGKVVAVYAVLGQEVSEGQILLEQDTGDGDIAIGQNQAVYQQAAADAVTSEASFYANYEKAKTNYDRTVVWHQRYTQLYEGGGISREALDTSAQQVADAKAALDILANQIQSGAVSSIQYSQAAMEKAQQGVKAAEKQRNDLILRAPRAGVIGYRQAEVGNFLSAGQKVLSIYDNSKIYVDCLLSEQDMGALQVGMNVPVQLESIGKTVPGNIIYISPANDSQNLSFSVRISLPGMDPAIRSGMFAKVLIQSPLRQNVLVVPKDSVVEKNGECFVFVVDPQNSIEQRTVQVGARGDQSIEILNGVSQGEKIAVTNLARLRSGMVITPNEVARESVGGNNQ